MTLVGLSSVITVCRIVKVMILATSYRSPISICGRLCKISLTSCLITVQNLVVSHTVCAYVGGPKSLGMWDVGATSQDGDVAEPCLQNTSVFTYEKEEKFEELKL